MPELLRIHGSVIAHGQPGNPKAEQILRRAIELSQRQGALYWELRAALALAEDWQMQGRRMEAHALLAPLYRQFGEGFATPILARANVLLRATRPANGGQSATRWGRRGMAEDAALWSGSSATAASSGPASRQHRSPPPEQPAWQGAGVPPPSITTAPLTITV